MDVQDATGWTPLILAATSLYNYEESDHLKAVNILLEAGADPDHVTSDSTTALLMALQRKREHNLQMVMALISAGAGVNVQDEEGETALMKAIDLGKVEVVRVLLEAGADPNTVSDRYGSPLDRAEWDDHDEIAALLREHGAMARLSD